MDGPGRRGLLIALTVLGLAVACGVGVRVVARVGGHEVEVQELQAYLAEITGMDWRMVDERVASRLLDQFLDQEVVAAAVAQRRRVEIPLEPGARSAAVRSLLSEVCGPVPPLPEAVLEQEIARRLQQVRPGRAHVRQVLLAKAEEAEAARLRLEQGESFLEVSREVSLAPNADTGGELGFVIQGNLPEDLDSVIFSMKPNEVSVPVASPAGYHVFQVLEIVPAGPPSRSEVELEVRRELGESAAHEFTRECVDQLATQVGTTVFIEHLWFRYGGRYGGAHAA